jgi:hypothetical protein
MYCKRQLCYAILCRSILHAYTHIARHLLTDAHESKTIIHAYTYTARHLLTDAHKSKTIIHAYTHTAKHLLTDACAPTNRVGWACGGAGRPGYGGLAGGTGPGSEYRALEYYPYYNAVYKNMIYIYHLRGFGGL